MSNLLSILNMTFVERWKGDLHVPDVSLKGRTVLITGGNAGLGLESAIHFARLSPSRLILACRTSSKGEAAADRIAKETGLARGNIAVWQLDLASFDNVKTFAHRANRELDRLDVACLNAALAPMKWGQTEDGWERGLQVNDLATGLQAVELLPLMRKTADLPTPAGGAPLKPHLTIVASDVHLVAAWTERKAVPSKHSTYLAALNDEKIFNSFDRYNVTKLLEVLFVRELAKLPFINGKVVLNTVNPGLTKSGLRDEFPGAAATFFNWIARPTADSARNYVWAGLTDTDAEEPAGGAYVSLCKVVPPSKFVRSKEGQEVGARLLQEMIQVWKKVDPEAVAKVF
ncbi:hypothetical protein JCM10207_004184 [Rhodosporidiobolus poonsookiae]